ncbi:MAG TPA: GNAT family N-acetyltransferase [Coriobacteriia bacterium]
MDAPQRSPTVGRSVVTAARMIAYEVHEGAEALMGLRAEWEALEASGADHVFQTHAYARLWQRTVGTPTGARPLLVVLREDGRVVAIFPACRIREGGAPLIAWLGGPRALDYGDILFDEDAAETTVDAFVAESLRLIARHARGSILYLTNVRDDARVVESLRSRMRVFKTTTAPYLPISGTWKEYLHSRGRNTRHSLDRLSRRLSESGEVEFALLEPQAPGVAPAIASLVTFQRARFDAPVTRTNLFDERYVSLRTEQAMTALGSRVATLSVDGRCIAASLHTVFRGRFYCLVTGFDGSYFNFSPGLLLHGFVIRSCFENGWDPCDFCWGDEAHKFRWTEQETTLTTFVSNNAKGALLLAAATARRKIAEVFRNSGNTPGSSKRRDTLPG